MKIRKATPPGEPRARVVAMSAFAATDLAIAEADTGTRLAFVYHGRSRLVSPRARLAGSTGAPHLLAWQDGGGTNSDELPGWRRFVIADMAGTQLIRPATPTPPADRPANVARVTRTRTPVGIRAASTANADD